MRHQFGVYPNADAVILLAGLLRQLAGKVELTEADFSYPHKNVSVKRTITYRPEYRVHLQLLMHDGYKALTKGDPGRHQLLTILGGGQNVARMPILPSPVGHVFGVDPDTDYRMTLGAMVRRLGGKVMLREADFPMGVFVGGIPFWVQVKTDPLSISWQLQERGNLGLQPAMQTDLYGGMRHAKN